MNALLIIGAIVLLCAIAAAIAVAYVLGHREGYDGGLGEGRAVGFDQGYRLGEVKGYDRGLATAEHPCRDAKAYAKGYDAGLDAASPAVDRIARPVRRGSGT